MLRGFIGRFEEGTPVVKQSRDEQKSRNRRGQGGNPPREVEMKHYVGIWQLQSGKTGTYVLVIERAKLADEQTDEPEKMECDGSGVAPFLESEKANAADQEKNEIDAPNPCAGLRGIDVSEKHCRNSAEDEGPGNR